MRKTWGAALAALALATTPVHAACWNAEDASAATVRELQTMLMVATLRCHAAGQDIAEGYNAFLRSNKVAIIGLNDRLKAHFIRTGGASTGQRDYDRFVTSMANGYGADASSPETCARMASLHQEAAMMAGSIEGLVMIAEREAMAVDLPGGRCGGQPMTMASASTTRSLVAAAQPSTTVAIAARPTSPPLIRVSQPAREADPLPPRDVGQMSALAFIPGH